MQGWSSTYYRGSASIGRDVDTYVSRAAMGRPDVLEFAARYEGQCGGRIVVMDYNGAILRCYSRAEAFGAAYVARAFHAWNIALAALQPMAPAAPAAPAPELTARRRADFRDSGIYEVRDAAGTVVALLFRDPHDRQWYEEHMPGERQTHYSERWRGSTRTEAIACIVRRRASNAGSK